MEKFRFYQDVKLTIWNRQAFDIEAESLEEAKKKVKDLNWPFLDLEFVPVDSEYLYDTAEYVYKDKRRGIPYTEIYAEDDINEPFLSNLK